MAALLAHRARHVVSCEIHAGLARFAAERTSSVPASATRGRAAATALVPSGGSRFEAIVLSGSVPFVPQALLQRLAVGGRMVAIVGEAPVMNAQLITRSAEHQLRCREPVRDRRRSRWSISRARTTFRLLTACPGRRHPKQLPTAAERRTPGVAGRRGAPPRWCSTCASPGKSRSRSCPAACTIPMSQIPASLDELDPRPSDRVPLPSRHAQHAGRRRSSNATDTTRGVSTSPAASTAGHVPVDPDDCATYWTTAATEPRDRDAAIRNPTPRHR